MKISATLWPRRVAIASLAVLLVGTWFSPLDNPARQYIEAGFTRAALTFASARALNMSISALKGTELNVGAGLSATFSVGEVLDPFDDLVEQFGDLMLLATVSFGIQNILLAIGHGTALKICLTAILATWASLTVLDIRRPRWLLTALILGLMARFAIPVASLTTNAIFHGYLEQDYQESQRGITNTRDELDRSAETVKGIGPQSEAPVVPAQETKPEPANQGLWEKAGSWLQSTGTSIKEKAAALSASLDPRPIIDHLKTTAEDGVHYVIQLITVFLLETLIIPLVILYAIYAITRSALRSISASRSTVPQD